MPRNYWLDLFTGTTWKEFLKAGGKVSGHVNPNRVKRAKVGDYLLCYVTGISRWIGLIEVIGEPFEDNEPIWSVDTFPHRIPVKVLIQLDPENAVPVRSLSDKLSYFQDMKSPLSWVGHFRQNLTKEKPDDAMSIIQAMEEARDNPKNIPYDKQKYRRKPVLLKTYRSGEDTVSVPDEVEEVQGEKEETVITHEEIQWRLISLGSSLGLDVHVARNNKGTVYNGNKFIEMDRVVKKLPVHFDEATNKTIENIDVLWLEGKAIVAAFEVEHTTSIFSGLLRMSDLISMQPNINISLYIVAPDQRRGRVLEEVLRPTFSKLNPPLSEVCQFIPYSSLKTKMDEVADVIGYLKPEFVNEIAEPCFQDDLQ